MKPRSFIEYLKRLWPRLVQAKINTVRAGQHRRGRSWVPVYRQRASADAIQRVTLYRYQ